MTGLSHSDDSGKARMVDVGEKHETRRIARASGSITMQRSTLAAIRDNAVAKGDVLTVARLAGIMAAKRTPEIIPLCHGIALTAVSVDLTLDEELPGIRVEAAAETVGRTGVEMEALTAVSAALLTVYDMAKAIDRGMTLSHIRLLEKSGGRSGHWTADTPAAGSGG